MHIFSGIHKSKTLGSPKGLKTRPTAGRLREAFFNICQHEVEESLFLDLFAGSGAMGLEALSRGAKHATFVDNCRESIRCIEANRRSLKEEARADIIYGDVFEAVKKLAKQGKKYHIIFADPPYDTIDDKGREAIVYSEKLLNTIDGLLDSGFPLLAPSGLLFLEESAAISIKHTSLKHLTLKNARRMGRATLHYYVYNSDNT